MQKVQNTKTFGQVLQVGSLKLQNLSVLPNAVEKFGFRQVIIQFLICVEGYLKLLNMQLTSQIKKLRNANFEGQIEAINRSQAVIQFTPDGVILDANSNFLGAVGYSLDEIQANITECFVKNLMQTLLITKNFGQTLARGQFLAAEYKRFGKGGKEIWIQQAIIPFRCKR